MFLKKEEQRPVTIWSNRIDLEEGYKTLFKGIFHGWIEKVMFEKQVIPGTEYVKNVPSNTVCGLIEDQLGRMHLIEYDQIQFTDNFVDARAFVEEKVIFEREIRTNGTDSEFDFVDYLKKHYEEVNSWNKISDLPARNTNVLVTSGDMTIVDVAQWYINKNGKMKWQYGGTYHGFLPEHRTPTHWKPIPY